jgi:hypothetical protein
MKNASAILSNVAVALACVLCAPALAQQPATPPAAAPTTPPADKGAVPMTPEAKCLEHSNKVLEQCRAECAKDFNLQVRCTNKCESNSAKRETECKKPKT